MSNIKIGDCNKATTMINQLMEAGFSNADIAASVGKSSSYINNVYAQRQPCSLTTQLALQWVGLVNLDNDMEGINPKDTELDTNEVGIIIQLISKELAQGQITDKSKPLLALMTKAAGMIQAQAA
jgi:hypothetical protein